MTNLEDFNISTEAGQPFGKATWDIPTVSDNSGNYTLSSTHQPGDTFNIGDTTVTYTIIDQAGNMAEAEFLVHVIGNLDLSYSTLPVDREVRN